MEKDNLAPSPTQPTPPKARRRLYFTVAIAMFTFAVALAVGLGVGLTRSQNGNDSPSSQSPPPSPPSPSPGNSTVPSSIWQPSPNTTWQYLLSSPLPSNPSSLGFEVWDFDLFENSASTISALHSQGSKVICYFSAGSYEDWRPDKDKFQQSDLGKDLDGWEGEKWLNISSPNVRSIMLARLDLAVEKGCDGVDPDNVEGYDNDNGLSLTAADSIEYIRWMADAAYQRNLSIGLKNGGAIVNDLVDRLGWDVQEQCEEYDECELYAPFIEQGKPVFHVEYPKGEKSDNQAVAEDVRSKICADGTAKGFSTIVKNLDLDDWIETC